MKRSIFLIVFAAIIAGNIFSSCESREKKLQKAEDKVQDAKVELKAAQLELSPEYPTFKTDAEIIIAGNEKTIAELKIKINKPGQKVIDELRKKRIIELEEKNANLKIRLYAYEKDRSDWETFKREFKHDMDGIAEAFKDLGKDNKQ